MEDDLRMQQAETLRTLENVKRKRKLTINPFPVPRPRPPSPPFPAAQSQSPRKSIRISVSNEQRASTSERSIEDEEEPSTPESTSRDSEATTMELEGILNKSMIPLWKSVRSHSMRVSFSEEAPTVYKVDRYDRRGTKIKSYRCPEPGSFGDPDSRERRNRYQGYGIYPVMKPIPPKSRQRIRG